MSEQNPLVSVVMNCYNSDKYLMEAINSVYAQTYSNWEIIFWDNASTDKSSEIAKSYDERLKYFCVAKTAPLGTARNLAVRKTLGKYVAFLDCDDMYLPDKLQLQVSLMESEQCALSYGSAITINEFGEHLRNNKVTEKSGSLLGHLLLNYEINMQSVMLRKSVIERKNLYFDDSLKFSPDYDLFMRFAIDQKVSSTANYLVKYRKTPGSLTTQSLELIGSEVEITLNKLSTSKAFPNNLHTYLNKAFNLADFYKCLPYINQGDYKTARKFAYKGVGAKKKIIIFYLLLWLPINRKWLLKLILG